MKCIVNEGFPLGSGHDSLIVRKGLQTGNTPFGKMSSFLPYKTDEEKSIFFFEAVLEWESYEKAWEVQSFPFHLYPPGELFFYHCRSQKSIFLDQESKKVAKNYVDNRVL